MAEEQSNPASGRSYWYRGRDGGTDGAVEVLRALRRFRVNDTGMRRRAQADMDLNETDLMAIRYLIRAEADGKPASPTELTHILHVSTAATAKLLARLDQSGHIRREPNPRDGRAQVLYATPNAHREVRSTLGDSHRRMLEVAEQLTEAEQKVVAGFLDEISRAIEDPRAALGADEGVPPKP
ncbi:MAG TPA: MarR family transcriptional regulator [Glaciibacter sp.]|nr:MarR family transcriptional regulator [Glaciibacter sp.]